MDRSFLSDTNVVTASRKFVCIRLATYEDQDEADYMKSIFTGRSGQLENTTFCILSPDGKRKLITAGRGPVHAFRNGSSMAAGMNRISAKHSVTKKLSLSNAQLPLMKNLALALNVAAADGLPLIVSVADSKDQLDRLNQKLVGISWNAQFAGQFIYASVIDKKELKPLTGIAGDKRILVVEPGQFGKSGKVLAQFAADDSRKKIQAELRDVIVNFPREGKNHRSHVRRGIKLGIDWESAIPETDQQSLRAKERARGGR